MFGKKNEHEWKMFVHTNGRMVCQCVWQYICALSYERTTERAKEEDRIRARERHTLETGIEHRIKTMRTKKKKTRTDAPHRCATIAYVGTVYV